MTRKKLLKPAAAQAMVVRRYEYLQRTIGPIVKVNWEKLPTKREYAEYARDGIEYMYRRKRGEPDPAYERMATLHVPRLRA